MGSLDLDDTKLLICNTCIQKVQDSFKFKKQVVISLKNLEAALMLKSKSFEFTFIILLL